MSQTKQLELEAVTNFIGEYNERHKRKLVFCYQPDEKIEQNMPDIMCELNGKRIGIEISHSHGSATEAQLRLNHHTNNLSDLTDKRQQEQKEIEFRPAWFRGIGSLNDILCKKSQKCYRVSPVWLLIRNAFAPWHQKEFKEYRYNIHIPDKHPFNQIWLLCDELSRHPKVHRRRIMKLF